MEAKRARRRAHTTGTTRGKVRGPVDARGRSGSADAPRRDADLGDGRVDAAEEARVALVRTTEEPGNFAIDVGWRDPCDMRDEEPDYPLDELSPAERAEERQARAERARRAIARGG